jgi:hypothetical protein
VLDVGALGWHSLDEVQGTIHQTSSPAGARIASCGSICRRFQVTAPHLSGSMMRMFIA